MLGIKATEAAAYEAKSIPVITPDGTIFYSHRSQYWTDPKYTGTQPSLPVKAAYSTADYARDFAGTMANMYVAAGADVSPTIAAIARMYPTLPSLPVTTASAKASAMAPRAIEKSADELISEAGNIFSKAIDWLTNNLLTVVIVVVAIFVLPSVLGAVLPARRR